MKILKIIIALIISVALLYIARSNSKGQSEFIIYSHNDYSFEYNTVPKGIENSISQIPIIVKGDFSSGNRLIFKHSNAKKNAITDFDKYHVSEMTVDSAQSGLFTIEVQATERGERFYYFFEVQDSSGVVLSSFMEENNEPFVFKYIGEVPPFILISHILLILTTVFCLALAATYSFPLLANGSDTKPVARWIMWSVIACFLGGYPFGFAMNWYAFNGFWEGIPFGTDATDNKTQILFVYILFAMLSMLGSLKGKPDNDLFSKKSVGWIGIGSFIVLVATYLIPHSIQFSKELTYAVCYTYTIIIILIYMTALMRKRKERNR
jgi:hypothetical protein